MNIVKKLFAFVLCASVTMCTRTDDNLNKAVEAGNVSQVEAALKNPKLKKGDLETALKKSNYLEMKSSGKNVANRHAITKKLEDAHARKK